jgi:hypothetical protein
MKVEGYRMSPREPVRIAASLNKCLGAYAAAAGAAGVGLLAAASPADAKVIYTSTYVKFTKPYLLDLNHDGIADFLLWNVGSCSSTACGQIFEAYGVVATNLVAATKPQYALALPAGAVIGPAVEFMGSVFLAEGGFVIRSSQDGPVIWDGEFANGGKGVRDRYIGLKFIIGGETHYGWARISVSIPNPKVLAFTPIMTGYAYETEPNKAITAGQTTGAEVVPAVAALNAPPAASLGLLARGAQALAIWRREEQ